MLLGVYSLKGYIDLNLVFYLIRKEKMNLGKNDVGKFYGGKGGSFGVRV